MYEKIFYIQPLSEKKITINNKFIVTTIENNRHLF